MWTTWHVIHTVEVLAAAHPPALDAEFMTNGLIRIARGCWLPEADATDLRARCVAVLETSTPDSVIASITAARLHGLWVPEETDERIHVATAVPDRVGRSMSRSQRPQLVAHRFQLRTDDIVLLDGLPVTSLARTWRDLACVLELPDLVAAGDSALRSGITEDDLVDVLRSSSRRHHARRAAEALTLLDRRSRSRPESHLRVAISGFDMPQFEVNEPIYRREGGWLAEPDLSLEPARIALEYQGADHAKLIRMRRDLTRFFDMRNGEWAVVPYGPAEVFNRPWQIKQEVRRLIIARAPHLLPARRPIRTVVSSRVSGDL
ncbi:MAG TPA: hypothetical protein VGH30_00625 [Jatrophihabitantaceae bacterium]